jgi:hypothetical protein
MVEALLDGCLFEQDVLKVLQSDLTFRDAVAVQLKSLDKASELFDKADTNGDGKLQVRFRASCVMFNG